MTDKVKTSKVESLHDIDLVTLQAVMQARVPAMLVGPPGTGKTATIKSIAKKIGYRLETVIGSRMDPTDVTGLPRSEEFGETSDGTKLYATSYSMPVWQANILRHPKTILFLDEFSNTPSEVRASFLNIIEDREFPSGAKMPADTIIVGAMNPTEQAADGFELDLPTTNRMFFMEWRPTLASWLAGMKDDWGRPDISEQELKYREKIIRYIADNPGDLEAFPDENQGAISRSNPSATEVAKYAWASRRTWNKVAVALGVAEERPIIQDTITKGLIGFSNSAKFRDFLTRDTTFDPHAILEDPKSIEWAELEVNDMRLILQSTVDITAEALSSENLKDNPNAHIPLLQMMNILALVAHHERGSEGVAFMQGVLSMFGSHKRSFSKEGATKLKETVQKLMPMYRDFTKDVTKK